MGPLSLLQPEFGLFDHLQHRHRMTSRLSLGQANLTDQGDDGYMIEINAPGLGREHVDVKLTDNNLLTVSGIKYAPTAESADATTSSADNSAADGAETRTVIRRSSSTFGCHGMPLWARSAGRSST